MKKNKRAYWREGKIFTRCPCCDLENEGGAWLAAHSVFDDLLATCPGCGEQFDLGKIPRPPPK